MFAARKTSFFCDRWNINKPTPTATQLLNQPNPRLIDISFAALWVSNMAMCQQLKFISLAAVSLFQTPHCPVFQNPWPKAYHPRFIQEQFHHLHMSFLRWSKQKHQQKTCKHHKKKNAPKIVPYTISVLNFSINPCFFIFFLGGIPHHFSHRWASIQRRQAQRRHPVGTRQVFVGAPLQQPPNHGQVPLLRRQVQRRRAAEVLLKVQPGSWKRGCGCWCFRNFHHVWYKHVYI